MAMYPKTLVYNIEKAVGINNILQNQDQKMLALQDPVKYNKQYTDRLNAVKKAGETYVTSQLQNYANSGLNQDQINQLVGQEAVARYQTEMQALDTLFPYRDQASSQIARNNAPRIPLGRSVVKRKAAPKRRVAAAPPKRKPVVKRRKTTKRK